MDRSNIKSKYCTKEATEIFKDLIDNISAKYIVLSYNNTGKKANDRSNARIAKPKRRSWILVFSRKETRRVLLNCDF